MSSREWKRIKTSTHSAPKHADHELSEASEAHMMGFPVLSRRLPPVAGAPASTMEELTHTSPDDIASVAATYDPLLLLGDAPREELALIAQLDGEVLQTRDGLSARQLEQAETLIALCALLQQSGAHERPTELELKDGPITLFAIAFDARFAFIDLVQNMSERQRVRERALRMHAALIATHGAS